METLKQLLKKYGPIAVAESLTSGLLQNELGNNSGASDYYNGGITAYNIDEKVVHLKIDGKHAEEVNCVSSRVADEMAKGICDLFNSNIGIGTTGYAENAPDGRLPYGFYSIYFKNFPEKSIHEKLEMDLSRNEFRKWFVDQIMDRLVVELKSL